LKWIHDYYMRQDDDTNVYLVVGCFLLLIVASFTTEVMGKFLKLFIDCLERNISTNIVSYRRRRQIYVILYRYTCLFWCFH